MLWSNYFESYPDFLENFLDFRLDTTEKQNIINSYGSYSNESYASRVFSDSWMAFLAKESMHPFVNFSFVFCL